jgi:RHS repeat-associated protein
VAVLRAGLAVARYRYDHKGRLALAERAGSVERYLYGPADELLAVSDAAGQPLRLFVRTPLGLLAELHAERVVYHHTDERGTSLLASDERGAIVTRFRYDPFGLPEAPPADLRPIFDGREWDTATGLYYFGARWYDPALGRFVTPDSYTGAPDDARLVHPHGPASGQAAARAQILGEWLRRPLVREPYLYCCGDPINNSDPNGHWSFGGVLLSILARSGRCQTRCSGC